jgi:acyl-coenzyme A thioesterase PaaI-like protein
MPPVDPNYEARVRASFAKVNLMAPAQGATFQARGRVVRAGRTLTVCTGDLRVVGSESVVAMMQATMMAVEGRSDRRD